MIKSNPLLKTRQCKMCNVILDHTQFYQRNNTCKKCRRAYLKERRQIQGKKKKIGFVYFVLSLTNNRVKIGRTINNPERRLRDLQTSSPVQLKLIASISSNDILTLENDIHVMFKINNVYGEWFQFSDALKQYIETNAVACDYEYVPVNRYI